MSRTKTADRFGVGARIGDYVVEQDLAFEETGMVYLGKHVVLPRRAAIKVMHSSDAWIRQVAVQMLKEACLLEALSHPGVPRVFECGVLADRRPWIAIEHIDGDSIGSLIASSPMAVADVVVMIRDVADILEHIHARGVVHRKLTAEALIRTPGRRSFVMIRHWANACALDAQTARQIDPRDDVRELGLIALRALTGAHADSVVRLADAYQDPTEVRYPGAPRDVASLIDAMCSRDASARPTAAEARDRAKWLADTLEIMPTIERPRWTPPYGLDDHVPPASGIEDAVSGFAIRIASKTPPRRP